VASPIFNPPKIPKSLELLVQEEVRAILRIGGIMAVAADTHPLLFAYALSKVQAGEDFILKGINPVSTRQQLKIYLVECTDSNLKIGELQAKCRFPDHGNCSLEQYLFDIIGEAFVALGFHVEKGLPDRYHREWVI
jgi:hypothetical protein